MATSTTISTTTTSHQQETTADDVYHEPIWLRGIADPSGILEGALQSNKIVDNVEIAVDESYFELPEEALEFVHRIGGLRGLKSFRLLPHKHNVIYGFPVRVLTALLERAWGLQMFSLCAVDLMGTQDDFGHFMETLRRHGNLYLVRLIRCRFPENNNVAVLDDFMAHLSQVPKLREVELCGAEESSLGTLTQESLAGFVARAPFLEKIRLDNVEVSQEHVMNLLPLLEPTRNNNNNNQHHQQLKGLWLSSCTLDSEGLERVAQMLGTNQTLEEFSICLTHNNNRQNQTTRTIITYTDDCFLAISHGLEHNSTLRQFRLTGSHGWPKVSDKIQQSFLRMLRRNYTLETLSLFDRTDLQREIDFYLALNRMGRKHVMDENATKEDWLQAIRRSQVDLDCLYYFLSMKPDLLEGAGHLL